MDITDVQKNIFVKSIAANGFSRCIIPQKWHWPIFTEKFWCLGGAQLDFNLWRH